VNLLVTNSGAYTPAEPCLDCLLHSTDREVAVPTGVRFVDKWFDLTCISVGCWRFRSPACARYFWPHSSTIDSWNLSLVVVQPSGEFLRHILFAGLLYHLLLVRRGRELAVTSSHGVDQPVSDVSGMGDQQWKCWLYVKERLHVVRDLCVIHLLDWADWIHLSET
jgi:hypothetical protein